MVRSLLLVVFGFAAIGLSGLINVGADDKKDDKKEEKKTLEGILKCTKCSLGKTEACGQALEVKDGEKTITYYLLDKGGKEPYHKDCCTADVPAKVTGKLGEKDGKKTIAEPKVEIKEAKK